MQKLNESISIMNNAELSAFRPCLQGLELFRKTNYWKSITGYTTQVKANVVISPGNQEKRTVTNWR
jgi:hypothetical protein